MIKLNIIRASCNNYPLVLILGKNSLPALNSSQFIFDKLFSYENYLFINRSMNEVFLSDLNLLIRTGAFDFNEL